MLVKLDSGGNVARYPYFESDLWVDHPEVSFPDKVPSDGYQDLRVFPVVPVDPGAPPEGKHFELAAEPVDQGDGTWVQAWNLVDD